MAATIHPDNENLRTQIEAHVRDAGFTEFGFAALTQPISIGIYEAWLQKGFHGEMNYLVRHLDAKRDPQRLLKRAQTAIVLTLDYVPHPEPRASWPVSDELSIARYARGRDYHHLIPERLQALLLKLRELAPGDEFVVFTDSSPVLERDLAQRAGLGWIGKNTCLLSRQHGSLFLIAEIYTTLALPVAAITSHDHCGTCTRCIDACPTSAITQAREIDARKCISYLTIESRELPEISLRRKIGTWFFGCDICQTVCPWNIKKHGPLMAERAAKPAALEQDLEFILTSSGRALERAFAGTPLMRAGGFGLKRNALIVAANAGLRGLVPSILPLASHEKLGVLARWALRELEANV